MRRMVRALTLVVVLWAPGAAAQETRKLEPVVVTATKVETPAERIGAAVTVITDGEITTYNHDRLEEVLRPVPGVEIQRSGSAGKTTSIKIRGAGSQQVQVLVDGMRMNSPTLGGTDLSELTLDAVDRIEIVRGPQSTLYGADAIGGVVNVITRKGQGPIHGSVWAAGGSYRTFREQANVQGAFRGFNFNVSGSRFDTGGQFDNDDAEQTSVSGRVGYDFPWKGELSLTGRYAKLNLDLPIFSTPPTVFDPNSQNQLETELYTVAYTQKVVPWWEVTARVGQWWNASGFQNTPPPDTITTISQTDARRLEAELLNTVQVTRWNTLTVGLEYRNEHGRNTTLGTFPSKFSMTLTTLSFFVQDEVSIMERLFLAGGIRHDDNDVFGASLTGRASAALVVKETGTRLRFAWGQGFRAPTINDLAFPGFGNADLRPERSESYEIGVDQTFWKERVRLGGTYFHTSFRDLIQFVFNPADFTFLPFNVGRALVQGLEAYLEADLLRWLTAYVNYTYTDPRDLSGGTDLRRMARHRWNTGVTASPLERLTLFAQATVVSSQLESTSAGRNPGYHRIDVGGTYRLVGRHGALEGLDLTLRIENLTNERYDEVLGIRALGFNALAGLRAFVR